ncbi:MAG: endolytic transglycosylase MltG, partial [Bacteroidales bacterium]|nr:endolytic transglycosylase MltG [Bacteroidales bacterium]
MLKSQKIKIIKFSFFIAIILILIAGIFAYSTYKDIFKSNVKTKTILFIPTGSNFQTIIDSLQSLNSLSDINSFKKTAQLKNFNKNIHPGKYILKKGMTNNKIVNMLRSGRQTPVKLTFNNSRTIYDFAAKVSKFIEADSSEIINILNDSDFIKQFGFNSQNIIGMFIPNTYEIYWNISAKEFIKRMNKEYNKFWNTERKNKAKQLKLTQKEVSILASIVQAEQQAHPDERPKVAGLYINRLHR